MRSAVGIHPLIAHPAAPATDIRRVTAQVSASDRNYLWLEFKVRAPAGLRLPAMAEPGRADWLWKTTCFELFLKGAGAEGYFEFNFSPSFKWAAYAFDGYRSGMRQLEGAENPEIEISFPPDWFFLAAEIRYPEGLSLPVRIGLSAILEEQDGATSYWALAHPPGPPDFHHPACFALELPPPPAPC